MLIWHFYAKFVKSHKFIDAIGKGIIFRMEIRKAFNAMFAEKLLRQMIL